MKYLLQYLVISFILLPLGRELIAQSADHRIVGVDMKKAGSAVKQGRAGDRVLILVSSAEGKEARVAFLQKDPESDDLAVAIGEDEQLLYVNMPTALPAGRGRRAPVCSGRR